MKSKPPNKKGKAEGATLGPPGTPENQKSITPSLSPAGSTSSTASSLLSIGPPPYPPSRPVPDVSLLSGPIVPAVPSVTTKTTSAKTKGSNNAAGGGGEKGGAAGSSGNSLNPSFPTLAHYNLGDFPKINACVAGSKGGTGGLLAASSNNPSPLASDPLLNKPIDSLAMEDLDTLQSELETLWSSIATQIRLLHREHNVFQSAPGPVVHHHHNLALEHFDPQHQEKIAAVATIIDHGTRTSVSAAAKLVMASQLPPSNSPVPSPSPAQVATTLGTTTKRSATSKGERLPKKKLKGEAGNKSKKGGDKPAARATQNRSHSVSSDLGTDGIAKHHEAPSQFWDWVDTYCRETTKEDLDNLAALISDQEKLGQDALEVPPLGKHFRDDDETSKLKTREYRDNTARDFVGPLTQRLVSALVEDRVSTYNNQFNLNSPKEDASLGTSQEGFFIHRQGLVRALGLDGGANTPPLENRIRECLVDQGLLLPDDANDPILLNPDDEVMAEIKRTQSVFKKLQQYNSEKMNSLYNMGRKEIDNLVQKRELEKVDKDVLEAYKTIASCRLKKKQITKKEKDAATKALEARRKLLVRLGAIGAGNSGAGSASVLATIAPVDPTGLLRVQV